MESVDTQQENNLFEDKISVENMMPLQHPDTMLSDALRANSNENRVKDMEKDSVDDIDQPLSSRRCKMIVLSDDDDSNPPSATVNSHPIENEDRVVQRNVLTIGSDSESDDESSLFYKKPDTEKPKVVYNRDIFDTELSDEDQPPQSEEPNHSPSRQEHREAIPSKEKKKVKKARHSSLKAQQELKDIHSESQRLLRESRVSLPYHRPKQRTLAEFLARRKQTMPPKIQNQSLMMTMRNMEILKLLEEKKKQVDEFYKSDSDSEGPNDLDWSPEKKDAPSEIERELDSCTDVGKSVSNFTLPDLTAPFNESSKQEESEESCRESLPLTNHAVVSSEDEGLGASGKNTDREPSSPSDLSQSRDIEGTKHTENMLPIIEHMNSGYKNLENIGLEAGVDTEGLGNREKTVTEEPATVVSEDCYGSDPSSDTGTAKLTTPKLRFLASKLREDELKRIMSVTPKLNSGKKDDIIDLNECSTPSQDSRLSEFMNRFLRHGDTKQKPAEKQEVNLNIVRKMDDGAGGERLVLSKLMVTGDAKEDQVTKEAVPGSRIASFKTALQNKIREQRELHRQKRVQEKQFMETEELPEDYQNDNLPDEEAELTDQSDTEYETESEPEENDVLITDEKKKKNSFVDDEAEEEEDEKNLEPEITDSEGPTNPVYDSDNESDTSEATEKRKRIIEKPEDDSEEEESGNLTLNWDETQDLESQPPPVAISRSNTDDLSLSLTCKKSETLDKDTSTASFDSSFELYGSVIAGHQPGGGMKHAENRLPQTLTKNKSNSFCSSISSISKKQQEVSSAAEDFVDIFDNEATSASPGGIDLNFSSLDCTQPHESNKENKPFANLQLDFNRIDGTQDKDDLIGLCSGKFSDQTVAPTQMRELYEDHVSPTQEINELLGLCSGRFAAGLKEGQSSQVENTQGGPKTLPISQDDPDDDELLGLCTSKFTMSVDSQTKTCQEESEAEKTEKENQTSSSPAIIIYSSEDDDSRDINTRTVRRKLKRKRVLEFSDDEDAQEPLAFDDEENEISATVFTGFKENNKRRGIRAEFLENEAELSGSDLNSGDEAEDSEDDMEEEEGDREHFDNNELRNQVGKAHLRSLLDSDKREVRLLQELYLEDGELHGEGRSRQFRWKNLDKMIDDDERKTLSDEGEGSDDNIEDGEWRKQRVEREKFIQEQKAKMADEEAELYEMKSWSSAQKLPKEDVGNRKPLTPIALSQERPDTPNTRNLFKRRRGSFLNRDKRTLARIAEFTRDKRDVVGGAKQGGNFVFQQLCADELPEKVEEEKVVSERRHSSTPIVKRAKVDTFSLSRDNSQSSSSIFEYL